MAGKTAKTDRKVEKMRVNHSAAAPPEPKNAGRKTPESPKIPLQLGCSVTQIRHFFKRTFFNLPLIFENNVKKATVWLHERGQNLSVNASHCHCPGCGSQRLLRCRLHPAGRCPNSSSLFPPLAAVVAVAPTEGRPWHSARLHLFARGSPTRGAVGRKPD